ncbi:MAG: site-2 protease family protein [Planctomycetota bacterium]
MAASYGHRPAGHRWSIGFGTWLGVQVRLHVLMLLFIALAVGITLEDGWQSGVLPVAVLLVSVLLHEAAHTVAALRLGGRVDAVVVAPMGGLHSPKVPDEPEPQLFVALVGPMTNLAVVILAVFGLLSQQVTSDQLLPLFNPVSPLGLMDGPAPTIALKQVLWINWTLLLLNALPVFPFDGGPALRSALWPIVGRRTAAVFTAHLGQGAAAALGLLALLSDTDDPAAAVPLWAPLVALSVFVFFSARRDLLLSHLYDADAAAPVRYSRAPQAGEARPSPWADDDHGKVLVEHTGDAKRELHSERREADEASEDARVDDILARLHDTGFDQLSPEDRAVLQRASRRYRQRQQ